MKPETHNFNNPYNVHLRFSPQEKAVLKAITNVYNTTYTAIMRMAFVQFVNSDYKFQNIRAVTLKNLPKAEQKLQMEQIQEQRSK